MNKKLSKSIVKGKVADMAIIYADLQDISLLELVEILNEIADEINEKYL